MNHKTSWENAGKWYHEQVGTEGHYYHQQIVLPGVLRILNFKEGTNSSLLDLACGQGVLARALPPYVSYTGIDVAPSLIQFAKKLNRNRHHQFLVGDITKPLPIKERFSHATVILALQNIEQPKQVIDQLGSYMIPGGTVVLVLNHPCFRIPRQSSWKIDENQKIQYRRIDRYMTPLQVPIQTHPGKGEKSDITYSFHHPISTFTQWLKEAGFLIENLEEWCSDKKSMGKSAKMEDRSRKEFPLFLSISALYKP